MTISKEEFGTYLFTQYEVWDHLFANAGTRFQEVVYTFDNRAAASYETESPSDSVNTVGMKYEYGKGSNIFWNVQQTFRYLATDEWYNSFTGVLDTTLDQQTGIQYEVGWQHHLKDTTTLSVTPYWIDLKDEIFFNPSQGPFGSNDNYSKTRRVGVEIGQETNLLKLLPITFLDKLDLTTNYTYQRPTFLDGPNDKKIIPFVPQHQGSMGINLGFFEDFGFSLAGRYVGSRYAINDTANIAALVKPYFTLDSKLTYQQKNWEAFVGISNIFDKEYDSFVVKSASTTTQVHYPAPERNFTIGTKIKF